jgi:predicted ArsR family transcriptional regulator
VSVPERHYEVVARLLAAAVAESIDTGAPVRDVLERTAYEAGRTMGAAAGDLLTALDEIGYEPRGRDDGGAVTLGNCPFHRLARQYTALVCGVNLHLLRGVAEGTGESGYRVVLDPGPDRCCVRLIPPP